ncbi:hypothetical protein [Winogradskyella sp.]|uniref:hypothetical protein n=1 Tax=Winogradskyella sp. TaxID=1883156 RepID=UPI0026020B80|nr:hypothetical protein [Winogradskyella sp.]
MKKIILLLLLCSFSVIMFSQNAFYDAKAIRSLPNNNLLPSGKFEINISPNEIDSMKDVFVKYGLIINPGDNGTTVHVKIKNLFANNPFITIGAMAQGGPALFAGQKITPVESSPVSGVGGLNVTTIADGLAKFLVERTKQELSITFFQKFKSVLDDPNYADFKTLFPETYGTLEVIDKEVYQFSHYINTLRETFEKDLQNMLTRLEPFLKTIKMNRYAASQTDVIAQKIEYFESALLIINNIRQGVHPAEAIGKLEYQNYHANNTPLIQIQEGVKLFNIFSNSLRSTDPNRYWIDSSELESLLDNNTFKVYLGLLYQLNGNDMVNGQPLRTYLSQVANATFSIDRYKEFVKGLILDSEQIVLGVQNIKQKKTNGDSIGSYKELFQSTLGFLRTLKQGDALNLGLSIRNSNKTWEVLELLNAIYLDINERKYNALILDVSDLLTELLGSANFVWKDDFIKYGTFIANVAQAENSEEVKSAIEAIALPAGSSSIKKRSKFNVSLNAYVGLSPGWEYNGDTKDSKLSLGINAPIGVAASWGIRDKDNKEHGSFSLFVPLIDIGAVTNFRFDDDMTEELPEIKLQNIFAPGFYVVHGWAKLPISWGLGGQLGPQLREVNAMTNTFDSDPSFSFRAFIAVDIPLLNFYTKLR